MHQTDSTDDIQFAVEANYLYSINPHLASSHIWHRKLSLNQNQSTVSCNDGLLFDLLGLTEQLV